MNSTRTQQSLAQNRLILDVSSLARWSGPPAGIPRVLHALATAARDRPGAVIAVFDHAAAAFRPIRPEWQAIALGWSGIIDLDRPRERRAGWRRLIPNRRPLVDALERWRLRWTGLPARLTDTVQLWVLSIRSHDTPVRDDAGQRVARLPIETALAPPLALGPTDLLFAAGAGWAHVPIATLVAMQRRDGFRIATLCYDLIPLTHRQWWPKEVPEQFETHWRALLPITERVVATAECIASDMRGLCAGWGIAAPPIVVLPLGYDPPAPAPAAALPNGLQPKRFVLFVSTIEPRKGHATLLAAWRTLLDRGLPQRTGVRLVFVGRPGWMIDDVVQAIADPALQGTLLHLPWVGGATLEALYDAAAFCVYPSAYEGFGLPIIEAFARNTPVLASTGGAVAETAAGLAPCLPPGDAAAWATAIGDWIERPAEMAPWAQHIRDHFRHPGWPAAAAAILDAVSPPGPQTEQP